MTDLQICLLVLAKFIKSIWPVLAYSIVGLAIIWRSEKPEKERIAKIIKRKKLKRKHYKEHLAGRK